MRPAAILNGERGMVEWGTTNEEQGRKNRERGIFIMEREIFKLLLSKMSESCFVKDNKITIQFK